jgi:integral membrane sensor domain MASE1
LDSPAKDQRPVEVFRIALLTGTAVFVTTWLSVMISAYTHGVVPVWPANAVVLAAMLARPERQWAPLLALGFVGGLAGNLVAGNPGALSLVLSLSNAVEISVCSFGLRFLLKGPPDFSKRQDLWSFVLLCSAAAITSALTTSRFFGGATSSPGPCRTGWGC